MGRGLNRQLVSQGVGNGTESLIGLMLGFEIAHASQIPNPCIPLFG